MDYHLSIAGERSGPYSQFKVIEKIREGSLQGDELVWRVGQEGWIPLKDLEDFSSYWPPTAAEVAMAEAARELARTELDRPQPWMRFWGRMVDYLWFSSLLSMLIALLAPTNTVEWLQTQYWLHFVSQPLVGLLFVPLEAWFLSRRGTTPGKALLRVQVSAKDGGLPTYQQGLVRSINAWMLGMACLIHPFFYLLGMAWWRILLVRRRSTPWDDRAGTRVEHGQPESWRLWVLVCMVILLALMFVNTIQSDEFKAMMSNLPK